MAWKIIEENPKYEVSDDGLVRHIASGRMMTQRKDRDGYLFVDLCVSRGRVIHRRVSRLVALAFVDGYFENAQVNHKDEDKNNNKADNLEWCTCKHNINYGTRTERAIAHCKKPVAQIKNNLVVAIYESTCEAQRATGVWQQNISKCCNKRPGYATAGGFEWRYAK